ncbi:MAG: response regulator [Tissierellales bacterium]|jgi:YesN/AraC family two-component response regulator|nr:response regulator [Tissierellales bacterium]
MADEITRDINEKHRVTVMFVDDEMMVLKALRRALRKEPFNKIYVNDPRKVMDIFEREEIAVIVTDMKMPHIDGLKLLKMVKEGYPDTIKIVLSGYTQLPQVLAALNHGDLYKFITKPWDMADDFLPIIHEAIEKYEKLMERKKLSFNVMQKNQMYKKLLDLSKNKETNFQLEINKIKELSEIMMQRLRDISLRDPISISRYIEYYENAYNVWLYSIPRNDLEFSIERLESDFKKIFSKKNVDIEIGGLEKEEKRQVLYGNYRLLLNAFIAIDDMIVETCKESIQKHSVVVKMLNQESTKALIFMNKLEFESKDEKKYMDEFSKFMNEVISNLGGSFEILKVESQYYYRLSTYFSIKTD